MDKNPKRKGKIGQNPKTALPLGTKSLTAFVFVALLFLASGFSSLIYQVVWTRFLVLVFGSTTFATSTVLSVFMGGLALGSFVAGKMVDKIKRPFLLYGILEGIIGIWALVVPFLFEAAVPLYKVIWLNFHLDLLSFGLLRFIVACAILILPTTCMGATLPLLAKFVTTSLKFVGERVGTLYATNTLGAVFGAGLAGFILLPVFGLYVTTILAALINLALLAAVVIGGPKIEQKFENKAQEKGQTDKEYETAGGMSSVSKVLLVVTACFATSGAAAMVYEVAWTRTLLMVIGSSTFAFSVMLVTFLTGIFCGSYLCARVVDKAKEPLIWFAVLEFLICLLSFVSMHHFNYLPWFNLVANAQVPKDPNIALIIRFLLAGSCLLPLTVCLGAIFPIVVKTCARDLALIGRSVGNLYSANTLGAIVGSFLAGFVLVPAMGVEKTLLVAAAVNLVIGVVLLAITPNIKVSIKALSVVATCVVAAWLCFGPGIWDKLILLNAQAARRNLSTMPLFFNSFEQWRNAQHDTDRLLFWQDGLSSTVGVRQQKFSGFRSLVTNGHVDASDAGDMTTQILLSAYPLLWKPEAQDVCVIGWGSGVTIGVAGTLKPKEIVAVELEPAVIEAGKFFHHVNHHPDENPIVKKEINDGRNFLLVTDKKFDVIISEPSNPWQAGVCNLFTKEYFEICHRALKPGGVFSLWLQTLEISPENVRGILASLHDVFPYVMVMRADMGDVTVLASDQNLKFDLAKSAKLFKNEEFLSDLKRVKIDTPEKVMARIAMAPDGIEGLIGNSPRNVDDTNRLEYSVGKTYEHSFYPEENIKLLKENVGHPAEYIEFAETDAKARSEQLASVAKEALSDRSLGPASVWTDKALALVPQPNTPKEVLRVAGIVKYEQGKKDEAYKFWERAIELYPNDKDTLMTRGLTALQNGDTDAARADFMRVIKIEPGNLDARFDMACTFSSLYCHVPVGGGGKNELFPKAYADSVLKYAGDLTKNADFVRKHPDVLVIAGIANYQLNNLKPATELLESYLKLEPHSVAAQRLLGSICLESGRMRDASAWWYVSFLEGQKAANRMLLDISELMRAGKSQAALDGLTKLVEFWPGEQMTYNFLTQLSKESSPQGKQAGEILASVQGISNSTKDAVGTKAIFDERAQASKMYVQGKGREGATLWYVSFLAGQKEAEPLFKKAKEEMKEKNYPEVVKTLSQAVELWPANFDAYLALSDIAKSENPAKSEASALLSSMNMVKQALPKPTDPTNTR
jgi:spermidine synthase